jgi:N-acetylglutamate synthase-like GNAT family acetyltransferase
MEVSFCCSEVFHIVAINWQIFDHIRKCENRNLYAVTTRVKAFFAVTGDFMLINATSLRKFSWVVLRLV